MRIGPLEIALIIIIIIAASVMVRIIRIQNNRQNTEFPEATPYWQVKDKPGRMHRYFKRLGMILVVAGMILSLAGISMFRWAIQGYIWALISIALGFVLLFLSRKK